MKELTKRLHCDVCDETASAECDGCGTLLCDVHRAFTYAECATRALVRQRRVTNLVGIVGAGLFVPILIAAIFGDFGRATGLFLPPVFVLLWFGVFAIPRLMQRFQRGSEATAFIAPETAVKRLPSSPSKRDLVCSDCASASEACSRCGLARCPKHRLALDFYQVALVCRDVAYCHAAGTQRKSVARLTAVPRIPVVGSVVNPGSR